MLPQERLDRINELAKKAKNEGLTMEEKKEQQQLREEYLKAFRGNFKEQLHTIKVIDPEGRDVTPKKLKESKKRRGKN